MESCSEDSLEAPDISRALLAQMEQEAQILRRQLRSEKERLERVTSSLHLTQQQIDFFSQETQKALEGIKDANWRFTKEVCSDMARIRSPSPALLDVCEKFLFVLDQGDRSWKTFRAICLNYSPLKTLMNSTSPDLLTEAKMSELLPLWKNQQSTIAKLGKVSKGGCVLAEWICSCVEFKLRKETLSAARRKLPELERKVKIQVQAIAEKNAQILVHEEKILEAQAACDIGLDSEESCKFLPPKSLNISLVSITSTNLSVRPAAEDRAVNVAPLRRGGTATGGLLSLISPRGQPKEFPNFTSGELYRETPLSARPREEAARIDIESENEIPGCCRSRFFCY